MTFLTFILITLGTCTGTPEAETCIYTDTRGFMHYAELTDGAPTVIITSGVFDDTKSLRLKGE